LQLNAESCQLIAEGDYGQVVEIILTASTFSFGCVVAVAELDVALLLADADAVRSIVPVISTLWPMCGVSLASSASSR
jgi:hypothetical protein